MLGNKQNRLYMYIEKIMTLYLTWKSEMLLDFMLIMSLLFTNNVLDKQSIKLEREREREYSLLKNFSQGKIKPMLSSPTCGWYNTCKKFYEKKLLTLMEVKMYTFL